MSLENPQFDDVKLRALADAVRLSVERQLIAKGEARPVWTLGDPAKVARYVGQVVYSLIHSDEWPDMLRRCQSGEVKHIYVAVDREPSPSDTLRVGVYAPAVGAPELIEKFKESFAQGRAGEPVEDGHEFEAIDREEEEPADFAEVDVFDVGQTVVQAISKLRPFTQTQRE